MTGFDRRLKDLLENVRRRAEVEGLQWRKAEKDVYAFRAGPYVVTFAKERDPVIAIYDEHGEELEAIDRIDLDGRTAIDGVPLSEVKARIWRLGRRGAGVSTPALDRVMSWLTEGGDTAPAASRGAHHSREAHGADISPIVAIARGKDEIAPAAPAVSYAPAAHSTASHSDVPSQAPAQQSNGQQAKLSDDDDDDAQVNGARPTWTQ